jgi:outer membrane lipoprotein SlyB
VLGGLLGHQIGKGHGRDAMTVVGAVGGGLAGHEVEKRVRAETVYEVRVRMDDGRLRTLTQKSAPRPGARVTVDGSTLRTVATQDDGGRT